MKTTLFILLFVLTGITAVSAQTKKNAYQDSVLCVIDGVRHRGLPKIDTNFIAEMLIYKDHDEALKQFGNDARNGVVIINTLNFEINEYQKKLSLFSNGYKQYLAAYNNGDEYLTYYINNKSHISADRATINKLYNLKADNIQSVTVQFATIQNNNLQIKKPIGSVHITTKY